ncbi:MAG: sulfatase-like hydrolase/transferase [Gammaproteobacteria bacterium]|nr:sulfatase-like hydrolase/transferase [Gammaproteobacteria bacterium]
MLIAIVGLVACESASQNPPNIIFLLADDQRADSLSSTGHAFSQTPNIDRLARDGVRFTNAFTVEPICAPSRFAFLSGQYERTSGLGFNSPYQVVESQWKQTYPALLRDAGYFTGFIGKFGVQFYSLDGGAASKFDYWRAHDGWLPFFPKDLPDNPATEIYENAENDITTEIMGEYIEDFLNTRPENVPFNLSVSFSAPHNSVVSTMYPEGADPGCESYACKVMGYAANENPKLAGHPVYDQLYRDREVVIAEDTGRDPYRFIPEGVIDHEARKQWYDYNYDRNMQPEHLIRYHQTVTGIDRVVGDLIEHLERLGVADDTIIIYSSDHGLLNGEYGTGGKNLLYDLVAKIPLIIYDPRVSRSNQRNDNSELVLSVDVPATILSYAGISVPETMEGRGLNSGGVERDEVFLESLTVAEGNPFVEALRTHEWKYVRYLQPSGCPYTEEQLDFSGQEPIFEQLFHLGRDPAEMENLVGVEEHLEILNEFRKRIGIRSSEMTSHGRQHKEDVSVGMRPEGDAYCW